MDRYSETKECADECRRQSAALVAEVLRGGVIGTATRNAVTEVVVVLGKMAKRLDGLAQKRKAEATLLHAASVRFGQRAHDINYSSE